MYGDMSIENDLAVMELDRASHVAAEAWRFRHVKSVERRVLEAAWSAVVRFARKVLSVERARTASTREGLSY